MPQAACSPPTKAYNLALLHAEGGPTSHGWCYGLPPGITPAQWPLDPQTGYPLVHGFTLRLPDDYRCHGPDIAGLSLFACCVEHSDGGTSPDEAIQAAMTGAAAPEDERYLPFWQAEQQSHPRLHRMTDTLGDSFAVILLSEAELGGRLCPLPDITAARELSRHRAPRWLAVGSGRTFLDDQIGTTSASQRQSILKLFGGAPDARIDWSRALRWTARASDPNAGKAPEDFFATNKTSGYQPFYYYEGGTIKRENFREHAWAADHAHDHIGGTMRPVQATPRFSPFYVEFEEYFGGHNFGGGNCQLDFLNMQLDWACG
jgi:hypothetical protein